jgi:hypothetical protein
MATTWHGEPLAAFVKGEFGEVWRRQRGPAPEEDRLSYREWLQQGIAPHLHPKNIVHVGRQLECSDPTRDRRVIEAIHRLPSRSLFSSHDRRVVFERAFADLLPQEVLRTRLSGLQNADWHFSLSVEHLRASLARYSESKRVRDFVNIDAVAAALDRWPDRRCLEGPLYRQSVYGVLPALSLASFLWVLEDLA